MTFEVNQIYHGFRVTSVRESAELKARAVELCHEATGCPVFWLDNGAENKVFSITFRTLPRDNTGVFHILEHSVLCGSDRYPVREPFVDMLKGSMNTYLNAMTFPDMTIYPVGSRNDRDLLNLTGVYLDAVFHPRILRDELVFRQEGWRIDQEDDGRPVYKGIVLNEMKGSMSDVDALGDWEVMRRLFPDNAYGFNSGGDPEAIPDLTYEAFLAEYRRCYHPSNAFIYLDGDVPMPEMLDLIASSLEGYGRRTDLPTVTPQTPVGSDTSIEYELGQDEEPEDRGHLYLSRILGSWRDRTRNLAITLVCDVLAGTNNAPFKRRILEKELAQDMDLSLDSTCQQAYFSFHAENVADGREEELLREFHAYGEELARVGLDRNAVEASLNRLVFHMKEEEEPQGIGRAIQATGIALLGGEPLASLENDPTVRELRAMVASGELDRIAVDLFRADPTDCIVRLVPSKTLGERKRRAEQAHLDAITAAWSPEDRSRNDQMLAALQAWQETPDSPEALATLPMLKKEDADIPPVWIETEETRVDGVRLLHHKINTGGIVHIRIMFALSNCTEEELMRIVVLCILMGQLPTEHYDALTLQQEVKRWTGRSSVSVSCRAHPNDPTQCAPMLIAQASVLPENVAKAEELLAEVLLRTDWSDSDKIMEIVQQTDMTLRHRAVSSGHSIAIRNVLSHFSADYALKSAIDGDQLVFYIRDFVHAPEPALRDLRAVAEKLRTRNICAENAILSVTADELVDWKPFLSELPRGQDLPFFGTWRHESPMRRGYRIPSQTGCAVRGYRLSECGLTFHGTMWLAANILSLNFLWNRVRVQGGAYGSGLSIDRNGNIYSYSYRDPTPDATLTVDQELSSYLRDFVAGGEPLDRYIISSLNDLNPLMSAREKGMLADSRYFNGYTYERACRVRKEILNATGEDLLRCAAWLDAFAEKGAVCVVAHNDALSKCKDLEIKDL